MLTCHINIESSSMQRNWRLLFSPLFTRCAELISHIRKEVDNGKLPADVASNLEELYYNYRNAVRTTGLIFPVFFMCYHQLVMVHVLRMFCFIRSCKMEILMHMRSCFQIWRLCLIVFYWMYRFHHLLQFPSQFVPTILFIFQDGL